MDSYVSKMLDTFPLVIEDLVEHIHLVPKLRQNISLHRFKQNLVKADPVAEDAHLRKTYLGAIESF